MIAIAPTATPTRYHNRRRRNGVIWVVVRTVLLLIVVPALVIDRDQRGLHDRAANSITVRI